MIVSFYVYIFPSYYCTKAFQKCKVQHARFYTLSHSQDTVYVFLSGVALTPKTDRLNLLKHLRSVSLHFFPSLRLKIFSSHLVPIFSRVIIYISGLLPWICDATPLRDSRFCLSRKFLWEKSIPYVSDWTAWRRCLASTKHVTAILSERSE